MDYGVLNNLIKGIITSTDLLSANIVMAAGRVTDAVSKTDVAIKTLNTTIEKSSSSNDRQAQAMKYLTGALVFLTIVQVAVAWLSYSADRSIIDIKKKCYETVLQTSDIELNYRSCLHSNGLSE